MKSFFLLLILSLTAHSEILRLSHVVPEAGKDITRFEISHGEHREIIFIQDRPIVTTADVATADPNLTRENSISVSLSDEGGKKMFEATKDMRKGVDRIAIIIDGKVMSAPIVQSALGKNFEISGLNEPNEPQKLAARLLGKTNEEIEKIISDREGLLKK